MNQTSESVPEPFPEPSPEPSREQRADSPGDATDVHRSDPTSVVDPRRRRSSGTGPPGGVSLSDPTGVPIRDAGPVDGMIGPYRILRELGRGGMGVVYLAVREDVALRRMVALKLVHHGMAVGEVLERFERERAVLAALNHPNIARLIDVGATAGGAPYLVMEHVEGEPIDRYCDSRRLTVAERLDLFRQVCAAVQHAHQNLVVHRDIKPRNILVTPEGVPKLLDFGIAKLLNPALSSRIDAPTVTGLRLMTPEYASPEQVRGDAITTSSDIYALGVVLFELLTGHRPYHLRTRAYQEVERVICEEDPQLPSTAISRVERLDGAEAPAVDGKRGDVDGSDVITPESVSRHRRSRPRGLRRTLAGDLDNIVMMAMRKEPQRRYRSAESLGEDIQRHLRGLPVVARADTLIYRAAKFVRRNRLGVGACVCVIVALLAGVLAALWQAQIAEAQRTVAEVRLERLRRDARALIFEVAPKVQQLEGATAARRSLVDHAARVFEELADDLPEDVVARNEMGTALLQLGEIAGGYRSDTFGDMTAGESLARRAVEAFDAALALGPTDVSALRGRARALRNVADAQREAGRHDESLALMSEANGIVDRLVAADRTDARLLLDRAGLRLTLGDAERARSVALRDERARRFGSAPGDPGTEAATLDRRIVESERSAIDAWQQARADHIELTRLLPDDREARREHAVVLQRIATIIAPSDPGDALRRLGEAIAVLDALQLTDDRDSSTRLQRVAVLTELARLHRAHGAVAEAQQHAEAAIAEAGRLVAGDADNARAVVALIGAREARIAVLEELEWREERAAEYDRLIEELPRTRRNALIARAGRAHAAHLRAAGDAVAARQAVTLLLLAVRATERLAERDPAQSSSLALTRIELGEALVDVGRTAEARSELILAIEALRGIQGDSSLGSRRIVAEALVAKLDAGAR